MYRVLSKIRVRVRVWDPRLNGIQVGYGYYYQSDQAVSGTYPNPHCSVLPTISRTNIDTDTYTMRLTLLITAHLSLVILRKLRGRE